MSQLSIVDIVTRPGTYVLAFTIFIVTDLIKRVVLIARPSWKKQPDKGDFIYLSRASEVWNKVVLYVIPVILGSVSALLPSEFFWGKLTGDAKVLLGVLIGFCSAYLVKVGKQLLAKKTGVQFERM